MSGGWVVDQIVEQSIGAIVVRRDQRTRVVAPPSVLPADARRLSIVRGMPVVVDPIATGEENGFWHAWSEGWQQAPPTRIQRLYCNVEPQAALAIARLVTSTAPPTDTWAAKLLCRNHDIARRDRAVIYLPAELSLSHEWVVGLIHAIAGSCEPGGPPFVRPIARGIGWALDPGGGVSFGEAVCQAVASAFPVASDADAFAERALLAVA
jgi:hypothetical protein